VEKKKTYHPLSKKAARWKFKTAEKGDRTCAPERMCSRQAENNENRGLVAIEGK